MEDNIKLKILKEARENIKDGNINKAEVLLRGYLDFNNKDEEVSVVLAKIYSSKGSFKEALEILKEQNPNYFCIFEELVKIYIKLQKYDKLYNLWKKNKDRNFQDLKTKKQIIKSKDFLRRTQILLKSFVNKNIETPETLNYKERQYLKYDYRKALEHIELRHTSPNNIPSENTGSIFFNHYDIEELLLAASRNIEFEKREIELTWKFSDTYIFKLKRAGRNEGNYKILNYFRVATIPNTNKIITMYPVSYRKPCNSCSLSNQDMLPILNPIVHTDRVYREKTYSINKK